MIEFKVERVCVCVCVCVTRLSKERVFSKPLYASHRILKSMEKVYANKRPTNETKINFSIKNKKGNANLFPFNPCFFIWSFFIFCFLFFFLAVSL